MSKLHELSCSGIKDLECPNTKTVKPFAGELNRDDVLSHFAAFGDVENSESVAKALESDFLTIPGRRVEITADDDRPQDEQTFLDLNDDCIHEILSTECLSALDLCSVAETHPSLKDIAVRVFRRKYANFDIGSLPSSLRLAIRQVKPAQRILRNFGAVISDLEIRGWLFEDSAASVLKSVARHCSSTLESLYLRRIVVFDNFPGKLKRIFNNLHKLGVYDCRFEGASKELFAHCGSLVELELTRGDFGFIIENTFPKLQKFKCERSADSEYGAADGINFGSFISRHKNLTSIAILRYLEMSSLLPSIGDNLKQLEELGFYIRGDQTFDLSNFGHLRKLNLSCGRGHQNVMEAVRGWNNLQFLENLTLGEVNVDPELIKTLSQLKRLQVLKLLDCYGLADLHLIGDLSQLTEFEMTTRYVHGPFDFDFVALIERLTNLTALSLNGSGFKMDLETYLRIVDVVRARPDKSKLTFKLESFPPLQSFNADTLHSFSRNADVVEMII